MAKFDDVAMAASNVVVENAQTRQSIYWTADVTPANVDEHIAWAKKGGFQKMLIYHPSVCDHPDGYRNIADYRPNSDYPGGYASIPIRATRKARSRLVAHVGRRCLRYCPRCRASP